MNFLRKIIVSIFAGLLLLVTSLFGLVMLLITLAMTPFLMLLYSPRIARLRKMERQMRAEVALGWPGRRHTNKDIEGEYVVIEEDDKRFP